jgi:hypothetical protein
MFAASLGMSAPANAVPVALELQLLVDVSGSVDLAEYNLQKGGYVAAFQDPAIQAAIAALAGSGGIAVQFIEWSGAAQQSIQVGWTQITNAASANAFAAAINGTSRAFAGQTAPGSAINFGTTLFANNFEGTRKVIDVSGDGAQNDGASTSAARDAAVAAGITINGLPILGEAGLSAWYAANIVSVGGFQIDAVNFATFTDAVKTKIGREITQTPEPGTLALLGLGLLGLGMTRRRKA